MTSNLFQQAQTHFENNKDEEAYDLFRQTATDFPVSYWFLSYVAPTDEHKLEYLDKGVALRDPQCLFRKACHVAASQPELAKQYFEVAHAAIPEVRSIIDSLRNSLTALC